GERCAGEDEKADDEHAPPTKDITEATTEQKKTAEGERVGAEHPLEVRRRKVQAALDRWQRDGHDGRVENHHQLRRRDDNEREPQPLGTSLVAGWGSDDVCGRDQV